MRITALFLASAVLAGCSSSSDAPAPPPALQQQPASNTGSLAFVIAGGKPKLYFPAAYSISNDGLARLAVVDAAAANNTVGLIHYLDLGTTGDVRAVGGDGTTIVAMHRDVPTLFFLDAATDTLQPPVTLPADASPFMLSAGIPYYGTGVAVDAKAGKAWVAYSGGLLVYDLSSRTPLDVYTAPPTESFAVDRQTGLIYAPYYPCVPLTPPDPPACATYTRPDHPNPTDGLSIIDAGAGRIAPLYDLAAADLAMPLGREPDSVAVDLTLQLAVVAINGPPSLQLIDLQTTAWDPDYFSYGVSHRPIGMPDVEYTILAADPATHLLVAAQEYGPGLIVLDLAKAREGIVSYLDVRNLPPLPNGSPWTNRGDVHGAAIGVVGGRPYAFLLQDQLQWVARIDLQGVAEVMDGQGTFASKVAYISVPQPP